MLPNDYECDGQINFTDYSGVRGLLILKDKIEKMSAHPTTIVEECTYKRVIEKIEETIKEVTK
jgi:hypothetical protein